MSLFSKGATMVLKPKAFAKNGKVRAYLYKRDMLPGFCVQVVGERSGWFTLCRKPATFGQTCFDHARVSEIHDFVEGLCAFLAWVKGGA